MVADHVQLPTRLHYAHAVLLSVPGRAQHGQPVNDVSATETDDNIRYFHTKTVKIIVIIARGFRMLSQ